MSIIRNKIVVSRSVNFIVVSFNLVWASSCLLMCICPLLNHKGNYLSNTEAGIDNCSGKYVLRTKVMFLYILTVISSFGEVITLHEKPYFPSPRISWKAKNDQGNITFPSTFWLKKVFPITEKFKTRTSR